MELTPIKVRGKRRARREPLITPIPPKRRFKKQKDMSQKTSTRGHQPKASNLERQMPLEVLERIFWLSENANFPRASPRLGRLLSGPSTLRETFIIAFAPTWELWFGCVNGDGHTFPAVHSYSGWDEDADRFGGNPSFQTDILACSWVTIDLILECQKIWIRRYARNKHFRYLPLWGGLIADDGSEVSVGIDVIEEPRFYFYRDYDGFRGHKCQGIKFTPGFSTRIEVHKFTKIPDALISGPWNENSFQKLFWLVRGGARLSSDQTWELTCEGFSNAISDQYALNMNVIHLFRHLDVFKKWPEHVKQEERHKIARFVSVLSKNLEGRAMDPQTGPTVQQYGHILYILYQWA